jgi:protein TonB
MLLLLFFTNPESRVATQEEEKPEIILRTLRVPTPLPPPAPPIHKVIPPRQSAQTSYLQNIKMTENPDPLNAMKPIEDLKGAAISATNVDGVVVENIQTVSPSLFGNIPEDNPAPKEETQFIPLEKSPEFPGGYAAWSNFLNRYLQTPGDLDPGEKKVVLISFLVDVNGAVTGFKVVQSGGNTFDNEVIRVLKKMPKWKPAIQNGHPVAVPFTQPVTFVGLEQ